MSFHSIIWDEDDAVNGNVQHCAEHDVTKQEVEEVLANQIGETDSRSSGFPIAFGFTDAGRFLAVVYERIDDMTVYPVTSYDVPLGNRP